MKKAAVLAGAIALSGCANTYTSPNSLNLYNGPDKGPEHVAVLAAGAKEHQGSLFDGKTVRARVVSINGDQIPLEIDSLGLLPGRHSIRLACAEKSDNSTFFEEVFGTEKTVRVQFSAGDNARLEITEAPSLSGLRCDVNIAFD